MTEENKKQEAPEAAVEETAAPEVAATEAQTETQVAEEKPAAEVKPEAEEKPAAEVKPEAEEKPAAEEKPKVELSAKMEDLIKTVEEMTVLELSELVKALEDRFGVSAAAPMAMAGAIMPGAGAAGGAEEEEKTIFNVVLTEVGSQKIQVIKEIRALTSLGLKEAKDLVEAAPKEVKTDVVKDEAEKIKKQLEAVGAKVEIK
jgi:large subunit ribosomal protein L7/L12